MAENVDSAVAVAGNSAAAFEYSDYSAAFDFDCSVVEYSAAAEAFVDLRRIDFVDFDLFAFAYHSSPRRNNCRT